MSFKLLFIIESQEVFDRVIDGTWDFQAGAEGSSSDLADKGFTTYVLSDGGASARVTARVIKTSVNRDLTEQP